MKSKQPARCGRCGKRLKKGGDNYRLECIVYADFDGFIDLAAGGENLKKMAADIEESGLSEAELEEQVYFNLKQMLCLDCREQVIDFLKRND